MHSFQGATSADNEGRAHVHHQMDANRGGHERGRVAPPFVYFSGENELTVFCVRFRGHSKWGHPPLTDHELNQKYPKIGISIFPIGQNVTHIFLNFCLLFAVSRTFFARWQKCHTFFRMNFCLCHMFVGFLSISVGGIPTRAW